MQAITTNSTSMRRWKISRQIPTSPLPEVERVGVARSVARTMANQNTIQTRPTQPTTWNGIRQLSTWSVNIQRIASGVMMAPMEVPLCRTLFPIGRSLASSSHCVVLIAHGQCPPSNSPSSVRQKSSPP